MKGVMIPMREQPEFRTEIFDPVDSIFKSFMHSHGQNLALHKRMGLTGFLWFVRMNFQLDAFLIFTARLYKRPTGKLSDLAWFTLESLYDLYPDLSDVSQKKIERQAQFTLKAWAVREQALAQCGQHVEAPEFIRRLRLLLLTPRSISSYTDSSVSPPSAALQQFFMQDTPPYQQMPLEQVDMNQYLGTTADRLGLDMWGNLMMENDPDILQPTLPYGGFDFSKLDFTSSGFTG
jgi:hypothetical protein